MMRLHFRETNKQMQVIWCFFFLGKNRYVVLGEAHEDPTKSGRKEKQDRIHKHVRGTAGMT